MSVELKIAYRLRWVQSTISSCPLMWSLFASLRLLWGSWTWIKSIQASCHQFQYLVYLSKQSFQLFLWIMSRFQLLLKKLSLFQLCENVCKQVSHLLVAELVYQISAVVEKDIFISVWYAFPYYFITSTLSSILLCVTIIDIFLDNVFNNILGQ